MKPSPRCVCVAPSVTDIVILVVAADDGVMPQTIEAIPTRRRPTRRSSWRINKMDKPDSDPDRVRQELLSYDVVVEDMGGETQDVPVPVVGFVWQKR